MLKFVNTDHYNHFVLVGCGGTGARLLPPLIQLIKSAHWILHPKITLIDFDDVEVKNLVRQNFIHDDVGRNKAEVLAERYSVNFDIDIRFSADKVGPDEGSNTNLGLLEIISKCWGEAKPNLENTMVIMAVDSVEARIAIVSELCLGTCASIPIIDTGNEDSFGQVSLFHSCTAMANHVEALDSIEKKISEIPERVGFELKIDKIPAPIHSYLNMKKGSGTGSCADMDQTLPINHMMASLALSYVQSILYCMPIYTYQVSMSLEGVSIPFMMDLNWFKRICTVQSEYSNLDTGDDTLEQIEANMVSNQVGFPGFLYGKKYSLSKVFVNSPSNRSQEKSWSIDQAIRKRNEAIPTSEKESMYRLLSLLYRVSVKGDPLPA